MRTSFGRWVLSERLAKPALFQASGVIPINTDAVIDSHPAENGIINQKFPGTLGPLEGNCCGWEWKATAGVRMSFFTPPVFPIATSSRR